MPSLKPALVGMLELRAVDFNPIKHNGLIFLGELISRSV